MRTKNTVYIEIRNIDMNYKRTMLIANNVVTVHVLLVISSDDIGNRKSEFGSNCFDLQRTRAECDDSYTQT